MRFAGRALAVRNEMQMIEHYDVCKIRNPPDLRASSSALQTIRANVSVRKIGSRFLATEVR
jgi:hypothetical protein